MIYDKWGRDAVRLEQDGFLEWDRSLEKNCSLDRVGPWLQDDVEVDPKA